MLKILDLSNKKNHIYLHILSTVAFLFFGFYLITNSLINIISINNMLLKENKFLSKINIHEDFNLKFSLKKNEHILKSTELINPEFEISSIKYKNIKKQKFIRKILPIIIEQNEKIRHDRKKLIKIREFLMLNKTLDLKDQNFVVDLAAKYKINTKEVHTIDIIDLIIESVDEIPNSIVLAQAANESGWGTSRFATQYNALFGEYTFDSSNGIVPTNRDQGQNHLVKFFPSINESIESYFINLNSHFAYKNFRLDRQKLRKNNLSLDSMKLVKHLSPYAIDENYVDTLKLIIKSNDLTRFDKFSIITKS
tara:strand:- start:281 stop:1207 length:927 start_codon:yes stop_codon:yes gene_type:complete